MQIPRHCSDKQTEVHKTTLVPDRTERGLQTMSAAASSRSSFGSEFAGRWGGGGGEAGRRGGAYPRE